ncbi:MAG: M20/M25/M40 family metallo-hydrolase [Clostridia bacterium]|nr:M20/M25/M40 family metallo-hydrolase [Clostridia bacterium]
MMEIVLYSLLAVLPVFLAVLLVRAWRFKPKASVPVDADKVTFDAQAATEALRALVRCRTVSFADSSLEDDAEFEKLIGLLPKLYPHVFETCTLTRLPDRALLFRWKGKRSDAPTVLMAHYDVVPVDENGWDKPPFEAVLEDGVVWGRGTLDTKVTLNGVLFAADHRIAEGFVPENDVYFSFSGGEEINGNGTVHIVDYFEEHGIEPALVLDEGGAVVENVFPGVTVPCGMIGVAEKGMMNVRFTAKSDGGHASAPKPHTPVGALAQACCAVESHPFKAHITPPVAALFDTLGRHSTFAYRLIFSNLWLFKPILDAICKSSGGELNALMRTTVAFTQMDGSAAPNVIPPEASMVANMRLNPEDTVDSALARLRKTIDNDAVQIELMYGMNPSRVSHNDGEAFDRVAKAVLSTWKGCIVSPYLMVQCSDSRHYGRISDRVYRFSAMDLTSEERATIHGHNERIRVETLCRAVEFYIRLLGTC